LYFSYYCFSWFSGSGKIRWTREYLRNIFRYEHILQFDPMRGIPMKTFKKITAYSAIALLSLATPATVFADELFGAIAYSQNTGAHGWAKDFGSQQAAENAAMNECNKQANDCKIGVWFQNACGAVAVGTDGGWGADWGANQQAAQNKAMHVCDGYSYGCKIAVSQCVTGY
jgi:Domain of unknown function (DUF4189)